MKKASVVLALLAWGLVSSLCGGDIRLAVLEFENNTGRADVEHLKKGLRDFFVTDLQGISGVTLVERGRIDDVLKEIKMTQSKYFDRATAAKVGKQMGASHVLTGSYLCLNKKWRMDIRVVDTGTGEILVTGKQEGSEDDVFDMEKSLVEAMAKKLKPDLSRKELRKINRPQTEKFSSFDKYSRAVAKAEHGDAAGAVKLMEEVAREDKSFSLAADQLEKYKAKLLRELEKQAKSDQARKQSARDRLIARYENLKKLSGLKSDSPEHYARCAIAVLYADILGFSEDKTLLVGRYWIGLASQPRSSEFIAEFCRLYRKELESLASEILKQNDDGSFETGVDRLLPPVVDFRRSEYRSRPEVDPWPQREATKYVRTKWEFRLGNLTGFLCEYATDPQKFWSNFYPWTPLLAQFPRRNLDKTEIYSLLLLCDFYTKHPELDRRPNRLTGLVTILRKDVSMYGVDSNMDLATSEKILPILLRLSERSDIGISNSEFFKRAALAVIEAIEVFRSLPRPYGELGKLTNPQRWLLFDKARRKGNTNKAWLKEKFLMQQFAAFYQEDISAIRKECFRKLNALLPPKSLTRTTRNKLDSAVSAYNGIIRKKCEELDKSNLSPEEKRKQLREFASRELEHVLERAKQLKDEAEKEQNSQRKFEAQKKNAAYLFRRYPFRDDVDFLFWDPFDSRRRGTFDSIRERLIREKNNAKGTNSDSLYKLGLLYTGEGEYEKAIGCYEQSLGCKTSEWAKQEPHRQAAARSGKLIVGIAFACSCKGDHDRAIELLLKVIASQDMSGDKKRLKSVFCFIAWEYLAKNEYAHAIKYFQKSFLTHPPVFVPRGVSDAESDAGIETGLGYSLAMSGNIEAGFALLNRGLERYQQRELGTSRYDNCRADASYYRGLVYSMRFHRIVSQGNFTNSGSDLKRFFVAETAFMNAKRDLKQAFTTYKKAIGENHPVTVKAQKALDQLSGHAIDARKKGEFERLCRQAAEKGDAQAQLHLGNVNFGSCKFQEALKWYRKAADSGCAEAQCIMGNIYHNGWLGMGIRQSAPKAANWFRKAAEQGDPHAQYLLWGYNRVSPKEQMTWLLKAADNGHSEAQYHLGRLYYSGGRRVLVAGRLFYLENGRHGIIKENRTEGINWLCKAVVQGNVDAIKELHEIADTRGDSEAQYKLGAYYAAGKGVSKDLTEAVKWLRKAAAGGHVKAEEELRHLEVR